MPGGRQVRVGEPPVEWSRLLASLSLSPSGAPDARDKNCLPKRRDVCQYAVRPAPDLESALRFATEVDCGSIQINSSPLWRSDPMPYGGLKGSGIGKEGPSAAIDEMTELKTVVFHRG